MGTSHTNAPSEVQLVYRIELREDGNEQELAITAAPSLDYIADCLRWVLESGNYRPGETFIVIREVPKWWQVAEQWAVAAHDRT